MIDRYPSAGLAHSAADHRTAETGRPHEMAFRPQSLRDPRPFIVVERKAS